MTSVFVWNTRWRHCRSWGETKYSSYCKILFWGLDTVSVCVRFIGTCIGTTTSWCPHSDYIQTSSNHVTASGETCCVHFRGTPTKPNVFKVVLITCVSWIWIMEDTILYRMPLHTRSTLERPPNEQWNNPSCVQCSISFLWREITECTCIVNSNGYGQACKPKRSFVHRNGNCRYFCVLCFVCRAGTCSFKRLF